jgi:hypothetical protein
MFDTWRLNQQNRIYFVMVNAGITELPGLGAGFTLEISKNGGAFVASAGTKAEISNGWYTYLATAAEADTIGPLAVKVTDAGAIQQNLVYVVKQSNPNAVPFTYTVTNSVTLLPVAGVQVWVTTDLAGLNIVTSGLVTDAFGVARDANGDLPYLDPGTYLFWKQASGYTDDQQPDSEVVS